MFVLCSCLNHLYLSRQDTYIFIGTTTSTARYASSSIMHVIFFSQSTLILFSDLISFCLMRCELLSDMNVLWNTIIITIMMTIIIFNIIFYITAFHAVIINIANNVNIIFLRECTRAYTRIYPVRYRHWPSQPCWRQTRICRGCCHSNDSRCHRENQIKRLTFRIFIIFIIYFTAWKDLLFLLNLFSVTETARCKTPLLRYLFCLLMTINNRILLMS
jgi:hypothetical protein